MSYVEDETDFCLVYNSTLFSSNLINASADYFFVSKHYFMKITMKTYVMERFNSFKMQLQLPRETTHRRRVGVLQNLHPELVLQFQREFPSVKHVIRISMALQPSKARHQHRAGIEPRLLASTHCTGFMVKHAKGWQLKAGVEVIFV